MAIAPFIKPTELGMRPGNYDYSKGGLTIDVEAFAVFFDEDGIYREYNIESNSILSWSIKPDEFFYIDENNGFKKTFLNNVSVFDVNGDPIEFGVAYPASRVSKITIRIKEEKNINIRKYDLSTALFDLTVSYLPNYLKGNLKIDNQITKKIFCTAPYKIYTNEYLILKNHFQTIQGILLSGAQNYIISGLIESEENNFSFTKNFIPNTLHFQYSTLGKKDILLTLNFEKDFLIKELKILHEEVFNVQDTYEDYKTTDTLRFVDDFIKIEDTPPYIAPNELAVEDNINIVFKTITNHLNNFLQQQKIVTPTITKRIGWFNTNEQTWNIYVNNINSSYEFFEPKPKQTPLVDVFVTDSEFFYIKDNTINELTKTYLPVTISKINGYNVSAPFLNVTNIVLDRNKKMFVLDAGAARVGIFKKNFTRVSSDWVNQIYFGGIGSRNSKNKFLLPNSIFLDNNDNLHVVDTGNEVIKKYSNDGTWLATIKSKVFDNTIIHGATDSDYNYHILKPKTVGKITSNGDLLTEYKLFNPDSLPIKIITDPLRDFIFVIYRAKIQKYYKSGKYIATIYGTENVDIANSDYFLPCQDLYNFYWSWDALSCAQNLDLNPVSIAWKDTAFNSLYSKTWGNQTTRLATNNTDTDLDFSIYSASIDHTRNLYVAVGGYLQKLLVNTNFLYLGDEVKNEYFWDLDDILIKKEEIIQDMVYNRSFQRMWDNIELVRKSVVKKMNVVTGSYITKYFSKKDFDNLNIIEKSHILIGQNETVTVDVVNRIIEKLWNNVRVIKDMLNYRDLLTEVDTLSSKAIIVPPSEEGETPTVPPEDEIVNVEAYFRLGFSTTEIFPDFVIKLTDLNLIKQARENIVNGDTSLNITGTIIPERALYNSNYSYHIDPESIQFLENNEEICNATPLYVEENLSYWMEILKGRWCPGTSYIDNEVSVSINMDT